MSLGLLPLSVWFFGRARWVGPLANLLAVPFVSFVVVPLTLAGTALLLPLPAAGGVLLLVGRMRRCGHSGGCCSDWPRRRGAVVAAGTHGLGLRPALLGAVWLLLPQGVPLRWAGVCLFLPLLWPTGPAAPGKRT